MIIDLQIVGITKESDGLLIRDTIEHALLTLLPRHRRLLTIEVEIALPSDMKEVKAYVHEEEKDCFVIALNQDVLKNNNDLILVLCHECVHIKQQVRNEYRHICENHFVFKGVDVYAEDIPYYKLPWEKEAYDLEMELARAQKNYTG